MIYKELQGLQLSNLGMGCMRLPVVDGNDAVVDQTARDRIAAYACSIAPSIMTLLEATTGGPAVSSQCPRFPTNVTFESDCRNN